MEIMELLWSTVRDNLEKYQKKKKKISETYKHFKNVSVFALLLT